MSGSFEISAKSGNVLDEPRSLDHSYSPGFFSISNNMIVLSIIIHYALCAEEMTTRRSRHFI